MSPSWYDLLDVAPDAAEPEIKAAWKASIADLDPTDRRFRVFNQAAETLLDPVKRAAYDDELAAAAVEDDEPDDVVGPHLEDAASADVTRTHDEPDAADDVVVPARRTVPAWLLAVVAVLTALVLGTCAYVYVEKPSDTSIEDSTRTAQSAAERAIGPILSYDALHLDEDQQAAHSYMTASYRKDYDQLFELIKQNAPDTKTIVKADVVRAGIVRSGADRVEVLLFVNRPTTNKQTTQPVVYKDQVTVTMQKVDGDWLVDDLKTSPVAK